MIFTSTSKVSEENQRGKGYFRNKTSDHRQICLRFRKELFAETVADYFGKTYTAKAKVEFLENNENRKDRASGFLF